MYSHYKDLKEGIKHGDNYFPVDFYHIKSKTKICLFQLHWHKECEIIFVISGIFHINIDNTEYNIPNAHFIFINSRQLHSGFNLKDELCELYVIVFDIDFLNNNLDFSKQIFNDIKSNTIMFYNIYNDSLVKIQLIDIFEKIIQILNEKEIDPFSKMGVKAQLYNIIYLILNSRNYTLRELENKQKKMKLI